MLSCDRNWKMLVSLAETLLELKVHRVPAARILAQAIALHYGPQVDGELSVLQGYQLKGMLSLSARALVQRPDQQGVLVFVFDVRCTWLVHQRCCECWQVVSKVRLQKRLTARNGGSYLPGLANLKEAFDAAVGCIACVSLTTDSFCLLDSPKALLGRVASQDDEESGDESMDDLSSFLNPKEMNPKGHPIIIETQLLDPSFARCLDSMAAPPAKVLPPRDVPVFQGLAFHGGLAVVEHKPGEAASSGMSMDRRLAEWSAIQIQAGGRLLICLLRVGLCQEHGFAL